MTVAVDVVLKLVVGIVGAIVDDCWNDAYWLVGQVTGTSTMQSRPKLMSG